MGAVNLDDLPEDALVLVDSAPIVYVLERKPGFSERFTPLFEAHAAGRLRLATTTVTIAEVLAGPYAAGDDALARRYRSVLESWQVVELTADIADGAARLRARYGLRLADAVQAASALAVNADALATADRDFAKVKALRIVG